MKAFFSCLFVLAQELIDDEARLRKVDHSKRSELTVCSGCNVAAPLRPPQHADTGKVLCPSCWGRTNGEQHPAKRFPVHSSMACQAAEDMACLVAFKPVSGLEGGLPKGMSFAKKSKQDVLCVCLEDDEPYVAPLGGPRTSNVTDVKGLNEFLESLQNSLERKLSLMGKFKGALKNWLNQKLYVKFALDEVPESMRSAASTSTASVYCKHLFSLYKHLYSKFPSRWYAAQVLGMSAVELAKFALRRVMIFIGAAGCGTFFHMDWTHAVNLALDLSTCSVKDKLVVAYWVMIKPSAVKFTVEGRFQDTTVRHSWQYVDEWLRQQPQFPEGLKGNYVLTVDLAQRMAVELSDHVQLVQQKHGDVVVVPPGWAHAVVNARECLKIAYDRMVPEDIVKVAVVHHEYHSRVYAGVNAPDYSSALHYMVDHGADLASAVAYHRFVDLDSMCTSVDGV